MTVLGLVLLPIFSPSAQPNNSYMLSKLLRALLLS